MEIFINQKGSKTFLAVQDLPTTTLGNISQQQNFSSAVSRKNKSKALFPILNSQTQEQPSGKQSVEQFVRF